jgi:hypothetical protein
VAAIDEDGELHARRTPALEEGLDRRANGAARVEHVVDEDDRRPVEVEVEARCADDRLLGAGRGIGDSVVAVERDVDGAEGDLLAAPLLDQRGEPLGDRDAARVDADEREAGQVVVALDHLVRDPRERAAEALRVEQDLGRSAAGDVRAHLVHSHPFRPLWTGLKGRGAS